MTFAKDWKEFRKTFGGMLKLVFVSIPGLLVPVANGISSAFGGSEFIPLGQYRTFAGVFAPVLSAFMLITLFVQRDVLGDMLTRDGRHPSGRKPIISKSTFLFLSLPLTLFLWGFSGLVLVLIQMLGSSIGHAIGYILAFTFMTLSLGLLSMKEYLEDRSERARARTNRPSSGE